MSRRIIAVLGMHRSGTSLATRGLQALGAYLGDDLLQGDANNPTGYWENTAVLGFDERLLEAQGLHWDAVCVQPRRLPDQEAFHEEACELLRTRFGEAPLIGVKDPRISRLLWFWQPVFRALRLETNYLLVVRDPQEVLRSLQARSPISASQGLFLWMLHYLDALEERDESALAVVDYGDLVADPTVTLRRVLSRLDLPRSAAVEEGIEGFGSFADTKLWRQRSAAAIDETDIVSETAAVLYRALRAVAREEWTIDSTQVLQAVGEARRLVAGVQSVLELAAIAAGQAWPQSHDDGTRWAARLNPRMPAFIEPGETIRVPVICTNEGSRRWSPTRPGGRRLALAYHLRDQSGEIIERDGERTPLRTAVAPGDETVLQATFSAPVEPGDYFVEWDMVSEGECWFGDVGSLTASVPFRVASGEEALADRYPAEVMPAAGWSPHFRKPLEQVRVVIVVRTWNALRHGREAMLERTLKSLRAAGHPFELVLFDNGSTDGTADLVAARGGTLGPKTDGANTSGQGMNLAIELALTKEPDLVVFSDDDIEWYPDFLPQLVQFWSCAPHDLALVSGFVEPRLRHNAVRGTIDCGSVRALVRETAPGGAWSFPAAHWRWIGPLQPGMEADWEACLRLRAAGFRLAQIDLAMHVGAEHSTWGNKVPAEGPISAELLLGQLSDQNRQQSIGAAAGLPKLSIVIVCYEMPAQVENTLRSLLPPYQRDIALEDYEIILVDNGSAQPLEERLQTLSANLRYLYIPPGKANPNPAVALNRGAALARAPLLCLMIDGARMVTPGVLSWGLRLMSSRKRAMVEVRGWHLGPKFQPESIMEGYNETVERDLLEKVRWQENGYRLFEISAASAQTQAGLSSPTGESNCIFLAREIFAELGGFDERVQSPGGGLVNLDFFGRAVQAVEVVFSLLGEGTFHQVHGGAATGLAAPVLAEAVERWRAESRELGQVVMPDYKFVLAGHLPPECASWLTRHMAGSASSEESMESTSESPPEFLYLDPAMVGLLGIFDVDLVLDVGANCGQFALDLIRAGYTGRILSFEPLSEAHAALVEASRGFPNWEVAERCALGEREREATINVAGNSQSSSLLPILPMHTGAAPASRYTGTELVPLRTLDSVASPQLAAAARPFLKLDVQGFESQVLAGAAGLLPKVVGLQVELDLVPLYEGSVPLEEMLARVSSLGFSLYRIRPGFTDQRTGRMLQVDGTFFRNPPPAEEEHGR